ncbi:hypothetical protein H7E67_18140 [Clostridium gasigenes]|uniref:Peptidase C39 family protein n=1 Tax=Clostridium gasigenes TaxID=94869 RepID=A0A7X0SCT6_9CLOT|nr:hypothetical protein [Clostridium gasigenes]MBB6625339.1 hypothetical protein [Clostridium gasigenes]MBB6713231.1 hypothetical protein [Clostridium gasigenes]MBU3089975.1 hypothetical protein [Clostridium gasigenes]MBU3106993.1 hypothetical protein [Clostridium gasigenes]
MDTKILSQPLEGLCGQTCIALLKNISVEEVINYTKCGKGKMSGKKLFEALDLYNIKRAYKMKYTRGKVVELSACCILSEHGHFLLYYQAYFTIISVAFLQIMISPN